MKIYNSLTQKKESFIPLKDGHVKMYVCGPTVYDTPHLGNARPAIVFDTLYRVLLTLYDTVEYARNITDIDDKIINKAKETGQSISDITVGTTKIYHDIMKALHVLPPTVEPKATESVEEMITLATDLLNKGFAYFGDDGLYFDLSKLPKDFPSLAKHNNDDLVQQNNDERGKRNKNDFALWKFDKGDGWTWINPAIGQGRPGWHLECSAMIKKHLGDTIDIHGGGGDLRFPHHEAEIAQSHSANGVPLANYWMHNGMITVNGKKMAKSTGNFITVDEALARVPGEAIRLYILKTHYRKPFDWTWNGLMEAKIELDVFYRKMQKRDYVNVGGVSPSIIYALADDLNTPLAIANLHKEADADFSTLLDSAQLMGLLNHTPEEWFKDGVDIDWVDEQIALRDKARASKDYKTSDIVRKILEERGIIVEDNPDGTTWRKK